MDDIGRSFLANWQIESVPQSCLVRARGFLASRVFYDLKFLARLNGLDDGHSKTRLGNPEPKT